MWHIFPLTECAKEKFFSESCPIVPCFNVASVDVTNASSTLSNHVLGWCYKHAGFAILLGGPMHREPSLRLRPFLLRGEGAISFRTDTGRCLDDALLNGAARLVNDRHAYSLRNLIINGELIGGRKSHKNLASIRPLLHECNKFLKYGKLETHKLPNKHKVEFKRNPFFWFSEDAP
eukprot:IDg1255t1